MEFRYPPKFMKLFLIGLMTVASIFSLPAAADFTVQTADPTVCYEFKKPANYGNGQTCRFKCAMLGCPMTPAEEAALVEILPEKEAGHYYGRFSVNSASFTYGGIVNRSVNGPLPLNNDRQGQVVRNRASRTQPGLELAIGKFSSSGGCSSGSSAFRWEFEYLVNRNFNYTANPVLANTTTPRSLGAEFQNNTLLFNMYYEFKWFERFKPFLMAGIGAAVNTIKSTLTPPVTGTTGSATRRYGTFAYDIGAGFRIRIFNHWSLVFTYRYINLGVVRVQPSPTFRIQGTYSMSPISLGVMYMF